jgi:hypothetical protein
MTHDAVVIRVTDTTFNWRSASGGHAIHGSNARLGLPPAQSPSTVTHEGEKFQRFR